VEPRLWHRLDRAYGSCCERCEYPSTPFSARTCYDKDAASAFHLGWRRARCILRYLMQAVVFDMTKRLVALACGVVRLSFTGCRLPGRLFGGFFVSAGQSSVSSVLEGASCRGIFASARACRANAYSVWIVFQMSGCAKDDMWSLMIDCASRLGHPGTQRSLSSLPVPILTRTRRVHSGRQRWTSWLGKSVVKSTMLIFPVAWFSPYLIYLEVIS
jgi:hypothetical protein